MIKNILIAVLLIILGYFGYKELVQKNKIENDPTSNPQPLVNQKISQIPQDFTLGTNAYNDLLKEVKKLNENAGVSRPLTVDNKIDITGDGVPELLVNTGDGGATMDGYTVVMYKNDLPELIIVRDPSGSVHDNRPGYLGAMSGGGGAGRYGGSIELLSKEQSIITKTFSIYGESEDYCYATVYTWNGQSGEFLYNATLSTKYTKELIPHCKEIAADTGVNFVVKE